MRTGTAVGVLPADAPATGRRRNYLARVSAGSVHMPQAVSTVRDAHAVGLAASSSPQQRYASTPAVHRLPGFTHMAIHRQPAVACMFLAGARWGKGNRQ